MARSTNISVLLLLLIAILGKFCEMSVGKVVATGVVQEQEFVPQRAMTDLEQNRSRDLIPILKAAKSINFGQYDDDHSNIELDKLNDMNRYEILPAAVQPTASVVSTEVHLPGGVEALILGRLVDKMVALNRAREKLGNTNRNTLIHQEHKRNLRRLAALREDKDYSFVANPYLNKHFVNQQRGSLAGNRWAAQKLRDLILSRGSSSSYTSEDTNRDLDQPLQVDLQSADLFSGGNINGNNYLDESEGPLPKQREKRRRCKIDPNLGVKNPSFCDTDAYFGAADYSMRDVWDSAGR